jgi:peptidoglycan/LPS O-acetylase OafA/YrhL
MNRPPGTSTFEASTGARAQFPELDMLRGLAISMVFVRHALDYAGLTKLTWNGNFRIFDGAASAVDVLLLPFKFGSSGVAIFFAISGFCIHYFYRDLRSIYLFYIRRFLRILPPYWFVLVVVSCLPFIGKELFGISLGVQFISHLFSIHNFWEGTLYGIAPAWWTIAVELQLYMLYPFVLYTSKRYGWTTALLLVGTVELSLRAYSAYAVLFGYEQLPNWLGGSPLVFWLSWTLGAWAADRRAHNRLCAIRPAYHLTFALLFLMCFFFRPLAGFGFTLVSFWTAMLLCSSTAYPGKAIWFRLLAGTGIISYSLYLISDTVLFNGGNVFGAHFSSKPLVFVILLMSFGPAYLLANYIYAKVEKPSQELGRRIYRSASESGKGGDISRPLKSSAGRWPAPALDDTRLKKPALNLSDDLRPASSGDDVARFDRPRLEQ